jgi:phosphatidate cytidylyltransferase
MGLSSLQLRILTASVLAPLAIGAVFALPTAYLAPLLLAVMAVAAWEWAGLSGLRALRSRAAYVLALSLPLLALWYWAPDGRYPWPALAPVVLGLALLCWLLALWAVWRFPRLPAWMTRRTVLAAAGLVLLCPAWLALVVLHGGGHDAEGPWRVTILLALIWGADTAAYFSGRRWGRRRLAYRVSPAKTLEGAAGALAAAFGISLAAAWGLRLPPGRWPLFVALCLAVVLFSILGDLWESVLKRLRGVKDSGSLLPGHGGMLDRIDSLTAAAPVFALGWFYCCGGESA